jgi:hypothetical protein
VLLFPHHEFRLESPLPPEEITVRLAATVEPRRRFRWLNWDGEKPFEGEVKADEFEIRRVTGYRNSFLPEVSGRVIPTAHGSRIEGRMRLHTAVAVFMVVWFGMGGMFTAVMWLSVLAGKKWEPVFLAPLGLLAFGWLICVGGFNYEVSRALRMLRDVATREREWTESR